jgi:phosphomevalonate kinase
VADEAPAGGGTPGLDMEAISKLLDEKLNRIVGSRLNRDSLGKLLEEKVNAALGGEGLTKAIESALGKMVEETPDEPSTTATPPSGNSAGKGNGAGKQQQDDPQIAELKKQLEAVRKAQQVAEAKAAEKERALTQQAAQAKEQRTIAHVRTELSKALGGNDAMAAVLAKDLVKDRKWVDEGPDGSFVWNVTKQDALGGTITEPIAFAEGLKAWAYEESLTRRS